MIIFFIQKFWIESFGQVDDNTNLKEFTQKNPRLEAGVLRSQNGLRPNQ